MKPYQIVLVLVLLLFVDHTARVAGVSWLRPSAPIRLAASGCQWISDLCLSALSTVLVWISQAWEWIGPFLIECLQPLKRLAIYLGDWLRVLVDALVDFLEAFARIWRLEELGLTVQDYGELLYNFLKIPVEWITWPSWLPGVDKGWLEQYSGLVVTVYIASILGLVKLIIHYLPLEEPARRPSRKAKQT